MSADLINLRLARKARVRAGKEVLATENRTKYGRTKAERKNAAAKAELERRRLDGHSIGASPIQPPPGRTKT